MGPTPRPTGSVPPDRECKTSFLINTGGPRYTPRHPSPYGVTLSDKTVTPPFSEKIIEGFDGDFSPRTCIGGTGRLHSFL